MDEITRMELEAGIFAVLIVVGLLTIGSGIVYVLNDVPVKVYKGDTLIYQGVNACVKVESSGDTTSIRIGRGPFCLLPKAYYTGKDIRVEGSK